MASSLSGGPKPGSANGGKLSAGRAHTRGAAWDRALRSLWPGSGDRKVEGAREHRERELKDGRRLAPAGRRPLAQTMSQHRRPTDVGRSLCGERATSALSESPSTNQTSRLRLGGEPCVPGRTVDRCDAVAVGELAVAAASPHSSLAIQEGPPSCPDLGHYVKELGEKFAITKSVYSRPSRRSIQVAVSSCGARRMTCSRYSIPDKKCGQS